MTATDMTIPAVTHRSAPDAFTVYRIYDGAGALLYIGQTVNLEQRLLNHRSWARDRGWATVVAEGYPTRRAALDAEREAIYAEHPLANWQYNANDGTLDLGRLFLEFVEGLTS